MLCFPRQGHGRSVHRPLPTGRRVRRITFFLALAGLLAGVAVMGRAAGLEKLRWGTAHEAYFDIAFHGDAGLAVGTAGTLLQTQDGGRNWHRQRLKQLDTAILGVDIQADRILAVGQGGVILLSEQEDRWHRPPSPTDARLFDVAVNADGLAAAVGEFGVVVMSADGGRQWRRVGVDWARILESSDALLVEPHLYAAHVDQAGAITLAGEFGLIMRSADRGDSWTVLHKGEASVFSLEFPGDGLVYAVGQEGLALVSRDDGQSWKSLNVGSETNFLDISASPDGDAVLSGIRECWFSTDHGRSWSRLNGAGVDRMWFQAIARNAAGQVYVVGQGASVLRLSR